MKDQVPFWSGVSTFTTKQNFVCGFNLKCWLCQWHTVKRLMDYVQVQVNLRWVNLKMISQKWEHCWTYQRQLFINLGVHKRLVPIHTHTKKTNWKSKYLLNLQMRVHILKVEMSMNGKQEQSDHEDTATAPLWIRFPVWDSPVNNPFNHFNLIQAQNGIGINTNDAVLKVDKTIHSLLHSFTGGNSCFFWYPSLYIFLLEDVPLPISISPIQTTLCFF